MKHQEHVKKLLQNWCRWDQKYQMVHSRQTSRKWQLLWGMQVFWQHQMSRLVLKSQTLKFKPINASGKGWYNLGVRIYSLHISPSSSPSAQSWMKSHACPSLIIVPFQQLKEPSRAIFEREADPREKEKKPTKTLQITNCLPFHQHVIASGITLKGWTPHEIFSIQYLLDSFLTYLILSNV